MLIAGFVAGSASDVVAQSAAAGVSFRTIAAGRLRPLFVAGVPDSGFVVPGFLLATRPVTNADYLRFVKANSEWRRSRVPRIAADSQYLRHWSGELQLGLNAPPTAAVVNVSWFAASAYASWVGGRLPSTMEWELAAGRFRKTFGDNTERLNAQVLAWYGAASAAPQPVGRGVISDDGVADLHGVIWEWVDDFNAVVTSGESRGDSGPDTGLFCAGGAALSADPSNYSAFMRYALRGSLRGAYTLSTLGFRVARDLPPAAKRRAP
ncbi:MAG: formylglycine-generating enzyme family protein [Gemmatimonadaceae bacterium]